MRRRLRLEGLEAGLMQRIQQAAQVLMRVLLSSWTEPGETQTTNRMLTLQTLYAKRQSR